jgi:hypothetical protein
LLFPTGHLRLVDVTDGLGHRLDGPNPGRRPGLDDVVVGDQRPSNSAWLNIRPVTGVAAGMPNPDCPAAVGPLRVPRRCPRHRGPLPWQTSRLGPARCGRATARQPALRTTLASHGR